MEREKSYLSEAERLALASIAVFSEPMFDVSVLAQLKRRGLVEKVGGAWRVTAEGHALMAGGPLPQDRFHPNRRD